MDGAGICVQRGQSGPLSPDFCHGIGQRADRMAKPGDSAGGGGGLSVFLGQKGISGCDLDGVGLRRWRAFGESQSGAQNSVAGAGPVRPDCFCFGTDVSAFQPNTYGNRDVSAAGISGGSGMLIILV